MMQHDNAQTPETSYSRQDTPATTKPPAVHWADIIELLDTSGHSLLTQAALHAALVKIEWAEEKNRLLKMHLATLMGLACLLCVMLFAGILVLSLSWDTEYRTLALLALMLVFAAGTGVAAYRFQQHSSRSAQSFAATRREIAADLAALRLAVPRRDHESA